MGPSLPSSFLFSSTPSFLTSTGTSVDRWVDMRYMLDVEDDNLVILFPPKNPHLPKHLGESRSVY